MVLFPLRQTRRVLVAIKSTWRCNFFTRLRSNTSEGGKDPAFGGAADNNATRRSNSSLPPQIDPAPGHAGAQNDGGATTAQLTNASLTAGIRRVLRGFACR